MSQQCVYATRKADSIQAVATGEQPATEGDKLWFFIQQSIRSDLEQYAHLGPPNVRNTLTNQAKCGGEATKVLWGWRTCPDQRGWESWAVQPGQEEASGGPNGGLLKCSLLRYLAEGCETMSIN